MDGEQSQTPQAVQRLWWVHDGRWYQEVLHRFGAEAANEINAAAIRFVAARVGRMVARMLPAPIDPTNWPDLARAVEACRRQMWPEHLQRMDYSGGERPGELRTTVRGNYALHLVGRAGSAAHYRCPCLDVRAGWFAGLGLRAEENRVAGCIADGHPVCTQLARFACPLTSPNAPDQP